MCFSCYKLALDHLSSHFSPQELGVWQMPGTAPVLQQVVRQMQDHGFPHPAMEVNPSTYPDLSSSCFS